MKTPFQKSAFSVSDKSRFSNKIQAHFLLIFMMKWSLMVQSSDALDMW